MWKKYLKKFKKNKKYIKKYKKIPQINPGNIKLSQYSFLICTTILLLGS